MTDPVAVAKVANVTDRPELRYAKSGTAFTTFGIAWRPYAPKGEPEPAVVYYEVVCFGSLAENVAASLQKGDRAVVVGKGELEHWTGKDGVQRTKRKIVAEGIGFDLRFTTVEVQRAERRGEEPQLPLDDEEPF
jgi:single-strand DNA-binding protein